MGESEAGNEKKVQGRDVENNRDEVSSLGKGDILQLEHTDVVLNAKMHLINNTIDEIGTYFSSHNLCIKHRLTPMFVSRLYTVPMEGM